MTKKLYRRHNLLLQDPQVKAWYDEVCLGSVSTAKNYLRMIGIFSERSGVTSAKLLEITHDGRVKLLRDYIQAHRDENGASPASRVVKKAVISWIKFNGIDTDKDWASAREGRYLNVVRVEPGRGVGGNPTDFPLFTDLADEQILEAFVASTCAITGCRLPP